MITLHHLRIGRSIFTVWLLEELDAEYKLEIYRRNPDTMLAPPELKNIHPLGKSPVIDDDGLILSESGAITSYLLEKFDTQHRLSPERKNLREWALYTQWLHYPEGSVFTPLLAKMLLMRSGQNHNLLEAYSKREIKLHLDHISNQLDNNPFILGDNFSAADFGISYVISVAQRLGQLDDYPALQVYIERIRSRPAFKRAIEKAIE